MVEISILGTTNALFLWLLKVNATKLKRLLKTHKNLKIKSRYLGILAKMRRLQLQRDINWVRGNIDISAADEKWFNRINDRNGIRNAMKG